MWQTKYFKSQRALNQWCDANAGTCQFTVLFVNNGFAVEYRSLRIILKLED